MMELWFGVDDLDELRRRYDAAIDALRDDDIATWLANAARAGVSGDAAEHFELHWLDSSMVSEMPAAEMRDAFKNEFTEALGEARKNDLKTSMLVMVGSAFDVDYCAGANAMTVIITIPESAVPPAAAS
jgi:hypothetical protein